MSNAAGVGLERDPLSVVLAEAPPAADLAVLPSTAPGVTTRRRSETLRRTVLKAVTYRTASTILTCLVTYLVSGNQKIAISVGALDAVVKFLGYFVHERAWIWMDRRRAGGR